MTGKPEPVWIHPSMGLERGDERRKSALPAGKIPPVFLYASLRQSQLWLEVARAHQPAGLESFYREILETGAAGAGQDPLHVIALGAGGGWKERALVESLEEKQRERFTPLDASVFLALQSAAELRPLLREEPRPLVADLLEFPDLADWLGEFDGGRRRLYTAFGLTPNASAEELLPLLRGHLREEAGDELLISANLMPGDDLSAVASEYDNRETRQWLRQVLVDWGIEDKLGDVEFREVPGNGSASLVAEAAWREEDEFEWEGGVFSSKAGERLELFTTTRYTMEGFEQVLRDFGLSPEARWSSACGREGVVRCRRGNG